MPLGAEYPVYASANGYQNHESRAYLGRDGTALDIVMALQRKTYEPKMVLVKGGCYQMGSPASEEGRDDDERQHRVCVDDVYAATTETTVSEFKAFVAATRYRTEAERNVSKDGCLSEKNDGGWDTLKAEAGAIPGLSRVMKSLSCASAGMMQWPMQSG